MRITFYPVIKSEAQLSDLYYRACWYLPGMDGHEVIFLTSGGSLKPGKLPPSFGECGRPSFRPVIEKVGDNPEILGLLSKADFVLLWNDELNIMEKYNLGCVDKYTLNVSKASENSRHEAYHFAILRHELTPEDERQANLFDCQKRFVKLASDLSADKAYVFGTGPSLSEAHHMDFTEGVPIISNTIVRNRKLVDHIRPRIIAAGDPALHYGVSKYAYEFRRYLLEAMERHNAVLVMPMGYYPLFVNRYPHLKERAFGLPIVPAVEKNISFDLRENYQAACYANVLTMLLLPIGTTLAKEVHILGCDGRSPETVSENKESPSPFWNHHKDSEQEEIYETLKACHPSFFSMNYTDWYEEHCEAIRLILEKGEERGLKFVSATSSHIPALRARSRSQTERSIRLTSTQVVPAEFEYSRDTRLKCDYKVSIIVSVYNCDRYIIPAMENLLSQTVYERGEMEIVLIDSSSPGNERETLGYYMDRSEHIFYGRTRERETVYGAFNRAIVHSRGKYLMNLDTDNRLRNDAVEIFAAYLDTHPDVGLVYGNQYVSQQPNESFYNSIRFGRLIRPEFTPDMMLHKFYFGSELMWRKELNDRVGLYDDSFKVAGDYEMVCRYATVTKFAHVDKFYGVYMKNLSGVEYTNLELCNQEDARIRDMYKEAFPKAVDPPRVHIHYPIDRNRPNEYMTIICHTMSYDRKITPFVNKLFDCLEFPHMIYCIDQNSSPSTKNSIACMIAEGLVSSSDNLLPHARSLFESPISYQPGIQFFILIHGRIAAVSEEFMSMKRPRLTAYFKSLHDNLTRDLRDDRGWIDPAKVPTYCDHNEITRIDPAPHTLTVRHGDFEDQDEDTLTVIIQHYAPESQTEMYRDALKRCIHSVRNQKVAKKVKIIVSDDGSPWSRDLAPEGSGYEIHAYDRYAVRSAELLRDLDIDGYLYKRRTGYFSKAILWNAARGLTGSRFLVFLDDDHSFEKSDSLHLYFQYLQEYPLVIGNTRVYRFRDSEGVRSSLALGYDSPVVQGSNFGIHRDLLDSVGGFENETFFWGTGDDPALFWKLYLKLRPSARNPEFRACYVDEIVTENPYSGRWRENCRLDIELFIRDFMRRFGVHPNTNPSRNRKEWVKHIPSFSSEVTASEKPPRTAKRKGAESLSVIVPAVGSDPNAAWETVVSILEQNVSEPFRVYVVADLDATTDLMPRSVEVIQADSSLAGLAVKKGLECARGQYRGWIMPGSLMPGKALQGILSALTDGSADIVSGGYCLVSGDGFRTVQRSPERFSPSTVLPWSSSWMPGQPVFATAKAFEKWDGIDLRSRIWDMEFMANRSNEFSHASSRQILSLERRENNLLLEGSDLDRLIRQVSKRADLGTILKGAVESFTSLSRNGHHPLQEWKGLPWYHAVTRRNNVTRGLFRRLKDAGVRSVALYGAGGHTLSFLKSYWPRSLHVTCILDDRKPIEHINDIPVLDPEVDHLPRFDAVVLSSKKFERLLYNRCRHRNIHPVFPIYGNYQD